MVIIQAFVLLSYTVDHMQWLATAENVWVPLAPSDLPSEQFSAGADEHVPPESSPSESLVDCSHGVSIDNALDT
jgi:hypothetical protein